MELTVKQQSANYYRIYLVTVSVLGISLVVLGLLQVPGFEPPLNFVLLLVLAAISEMAATSAPVSNKAGITYHVGTAVSLATVPLFGPLAGAVAVAAANLSLWLLKPANTTTWKKSWPQLAFNTGMHSLAITAAGYILLLLTDWFSINSLLAATLPWLVSAIVYAFLNLWLLIGILRLQHGPQINPWQLWRENWWASSIDVFVMSIGGGLLAFAVQRYDSLGTLIFFLPIFLSAYAFRLYVRQMQDHMDHLEEIVAERTKQLASLHKEKDAFLAVLAHDMKQPLTSVIAYAELLRNYPLLPDEKRVQMADTIIRSGVALRDIVENVLEIEMIRPGESPPLEKKNVDLGSLISDVMAGLQVQANEKEIHLGQVIHEPGLCVPADNHKLQRILVNLISNAIKYTPENGTILVSADKKGRWVVITVQDTGYGIPQEELPHIFDRYRRVDKHKDKASGTGLGLAIVKNLVAAHGGEIAVSSEEGVGSTFTVKLPLA